MHANPLYVKVQNCTANAGLFKNGTFTDQSAKCIKIFWQWETGANNCWQTERKVLLQTEVYIHTYSFSGETEVASDLGFE